MGAVASKCLKSGDDAPTQRRKTRRLPLHNFGFEYNFASCYKLGKELGKGQFGTTYTCTSLVTGKKHAVKIIKKKNLTDKQAIDDVSSEVRILKRLKGRPNVVEMFGNFEDDENVYLVLELCEGGELFHQLAAKGKYTEADAAAIMRQVLQVVADCHLNGIIHRDLKPENFLFDNTSAHAVLKVIDFGLSTFFAPGQVFRDIAGSAYYVAPEVLRKNYGPAADLWSCGVILFLLLSGDVPFYHSTEAGIFKQVLSGKLNWQKAPWPTISPPAKDLIAQLLNRDPNARPSAAQALTHDWVRVDGCAPDARLDINIVSNMQRFSQYNRLKQAILLKVAEHLTPAEHKHLHDQFVAMDTDKSGTVSIAELVNTLSVFKYGEEGRTQLGMDEMKDLMKTMDVDGNGTVDYMEFVAAAMSTHQMSHGDAGAWRRRVRLVFDELDADKDGYLDRTELKKMLGGDTAQVNSLLDEADHNKDGVIDYEEFQSMLREHGGVNGLQKTGAAKHAPGPLSLSPAVYNPNAKQ